MTQRQTIVECMDDSALFQPWFKRRFAGFGKDTFATWRVIHKAMWGLAMTDAEFAVYRQYTGRTKAPTKPFDEIAIIAGRSGGKSINSAFAVTYLAAFCDWPTLVPGEVGVALCLASDKAQAGVVFGFIDAFFTNIPLLQSMVANRTKDSITIVNGSNVIRLEVHASDYRAVRGYSLIAVIADEIAFWSADREASSPDVEIINAVRPGLARVPGSKLILISSPYAERGVLYDLHHEHYGVDESETLIWMSPTSVLNPTISQSKIEAEIRKDPERMSAEYGYAFRRELDGLFTRAALMNCTQERVYERSARDDVSYYAFVDPSGGVSDSLVVVVAHRENNLAVTDMIREIESPCDPAVAIQSFAVDLKRYRVSEVTGDRYAGEWPRREFAKSGIEYRLSERDRSEIYSQVLPMVNSSEVVLLDHKKMVNQFVSLRRRTGATGKDTIDHPSVGHAHDDVANATAGALLLVAGDDGTCDGVAGYARSLAGIDPPIPESGFWKRVEQHIARLALGKPAPQPPIVHPSSPSRVRFGEELGRCPNHEGNPHLGNRSKKEDEGHARCLDCGRVFEILAPTSEPEPTRDERVGERCPGVKPDGKVCRSRSFGVIPGGQYKCHDCGFQWDQPGVRRQPVFYGGDRRGR